MQDHSQQLPCSLLDLLRNTLILHHISPYVGTTSLCRLAATCKSFQALIYSMPSVYQHTDLSVVQYCRENSGSSHLAYPEIEQTVDTDGFYALPLRRVLDSLNRRNVLSGVRTLILDGLAVPASILREILCDDAYNVRILSLRNAKELGDEKLIKLLRYLIRSTRPDGTPKLKGLYYFTPLVTSADLSAAFGLQSTSHAGVTNAPGAQIGSGPSSGRSALYQQRFQSFWHRYDPWYSASGEVSRLDASFEDQWATLIQACAGIIAFDAVLCRHAIAQFHDAQHDPSGLTPFSLMNPKVATIGLDGCRSCGSCPETPAYPGISAESELPLLIPPPLHRSSVRAAQALDSHGLTHPTFIARCRTCLKDRWCERCNSWWCEACYQIPSKRSSSTVPVATTGSNIKVHNSLCVSTCLMDDLLNGVGEGGMWG